MATSTIKRHIKLNEVEMRQIKESKTYTITKTDTKQLQARNVLKRIRKNG